MKPTTIRLLVIVFAVALFAAACANGNTADDTATEAVADTTANVATANSDAAEADQHEATDDHDEATDDHDEATDDHDGEADSGAEGRTVEVTMTELAFTPGSITVSAGETVVFHVTNEGAIEHEFRLSNPHRIEEHLASGHADHNEGDAEAAEVGGHDADADIVLLLGPGESGEVPMTFSEDTTVFTEVACLIPGHYEAGMKGAIEYA